MVGRVGGMLSTSLLKAPRDTGNISQHKCLRVFLLVVESYEWDLRPEA